ncbi:MAG: hypothetical protein ACI4TK_05640 [Agathobacter sp.]
MKIKIAICLKDSIYQERFVRCLMNHYAKRYEFHVFKNLPELQEKDVDQYDGFILENCDSMELGWEEEKIQRTLMLAEENKYREVYRIMEAMEMLLSNRGVNLSVEKPVKPRIIGVYSATIPALQLPFAMMLNEILGERKRTIFVDLQEFSGFCQDGELGLEDMMAMAATGNYVRGRTTSAIGHMQQWDYVFPLKNSRCLLEGKKEMFQSLAEHFISELGYEVILLNLGDIAMNLEGVTNICDQLFFLYPKGEAGEWREKRLFDELERKGEQDVLHRIQRMELPTVSGTDGDWKRLYEQWKWGSLGDVLRKIVWEDESRGQIM